MNRRDFLKKSLLSLLMLTPLSALAKPGGDIRPEDRSPDIREMGELNRDNILDHIEDCGLYLDSQKVPESDRWIKVRDDWYNEAGKALNDQIDADIMQSLKGEAWWSEPGKPMYWYKIDMDAPFEINNVEHPHKVYYPLTRENFVAFCEDIGSRDGAPRYGAIDHLKIYRSNQVKR